MRYLDSITRTRIEDSLQNSLTRYYMGRLDAIGDPEKRRTPFIKITDDFIPQDREWIQEIHDFYGVILEFKKLKY